MAWEPELGGIVYGFGPDGKACDGDKYFWVQAESLAATALLTGIPLSLRDVISARITFVGGFVGQRSAFRWTRMDAGPSADALSAKHDRALRGPFCFPGWTLIDARSQFSPRKAQFVALDWFGA